MKQRNTLLSLTTVASSILLASTFVSYRAGAFNSLLDTSARPADSGSGLAPGLNLSDDSNQDPGFSEHAKDRSTERERTIMSSSKSTTTFTAPLTDTVKLGANTFTVTLGEYNPKTDTPSPNPADAYPAPTPDPPPTKATERERTLLPGSKAPYSLIQKPKP